MTRSEIPLSEAALQRATVIKKSEMARREKEFTPQRLFRQGLDLLQRYGVLDTPKQDRADKSTEKRNYQLPALIPLPLEDISLCIRGEDFQFQKDATEPTLQEGRIVVEEIVEQTPTGKASTHFLFGLKVTAGNYKFADYAGQGLSLSTTDMDTKVAEAQGFLSYAQSYLETNTDLTDKHE